MKKEMISVIVSDENVNSQTKGGIFSDEPVNTETKIVDLPVSVLKDNFQKECEKVMAIVGEIKDKNGYRLSEIEVGFEISGEGGFSFIGTSKLGSRASLKLKITRS